MILAPFPFPGNNRVSAVFLPLSVLWGALLFAQPIPGQSTDPYPPTRVPDRIILSWNGEPATTQAVTWRTDTTVTEAVAEIALADETPAFPVGAKTVEASTEKLKTNKNVAHFHSATFTGLKPNTLYGYRVGDGKTWSEWFHFRTASDKSAPFSFLYFGDAQNDIKSLWSRCVRQAYSTMPDVDFLLHAGDLVNIPARDEEWGEWFYAAGWINGMKSNVVTPGNHEYMRVTSGERILAPHWRLILPCTKRPQGWRNRIFFDYQGFGLSAST
ncbi:MAG: fibronectin type III domain-containing protein, partial [Haliscomenobacter sp.]|nr:fibronectin type III domain-containing protein [Haliscomenobacter sp.]